MLSMLRGPLTAGLIAIFMLSCTAGASGAAKIVRGTAATGEVATVAPSIGEQAFMRSRYWRMRTFAPYFNARLSWAPGAWVTQHAYALEPAELAAHPEWQLTDPSNGPLYIGSRAAADFGNPAFRAWWIAKAQAAVAAGYRGLFIDDVFMERRTYLSGGSTLRTPKDPRTGTTMTEANWQKYLADFLVEVRAALPTAEIAHDVLWQKGDSGDVLRGLQAANVVSVDGGFTTNVVTSSFATLASWAEREQARGGRVVFDYPTASAPARLYNFAAFTLVDNGASALANDASTAPGAFWSGYDVDLGSPNTMRYQVSTGVWRRDFTRGIVIVNEPYRSSRTVSVPGGYQDLDGVARTSVTLAGGQGTVLVPIPAPVPTPTPVPPVVTPDPAGVAPVSTSTPAPPTPAPPTKITTVTTGGNGAAKARASGTAGAADPGGTSVSVQGSSRRLSGRVRGAVAGYVRLTVERKRGSKWVVVLRTKGSVKKSGSFSRDIPRLSRGNYRVSGYFEGTGTSKPSRSSAKPFRA
ncbi:putative glycoside hydrolase family 15 protein [Solirubrobacter taibaiensis]|nr:putative glycoside hydrolase family 15 protein [Solirubrobacter taibaiensis]